MSNEAKASAEMKVFDIPIDQIDADEAFNCRGVISPIDVASLAKDIEAEGLQPRCCDPSS